MKRTWTGRQRAALAVAALIALLGGVGFLGACGGASVGTGAVVLSGAPAGPPLDFKFQPPATPMPFSVDIASEAEFGGTSFISTFRFEWEARDWQAEGADWTCDLRFSKLSAAQRRGSGVGMESQDAVKKLEGFSTRFRKTAEGFAPVARPAKDREFLAIFDQLQGGLSPLDIKVPATPPRLGESWLEPLDVDALAMLRTAMKDSTFTLTYVADETSQGRACARIRYQGKIELDGIVSAPAGASEGGSAQINGRIEIEGSALLDKARGFMLQDVGKSKLILKQRALDDKGAATGPEQGIVQNMNYTVKYLGN